MEVDTSHRAIARYIGLELFHIWQLASHTGNLPTPGSLSRGGLLWFSNVWQVAKFSWHAAKSTPPDPPRSWIVPHLATVTKIGPEKAYFCGFLTLTFDLWPRFCKNQHAIPKTHHHAKNHVRRTNGYARRGHNTHPDGRKARKYIRISDIVLTRNQTGWFVWFFVSSQPFTGPCLINYGEHFVNKIIKTDSRNWFMNVNLCFVKYFLLKSIFSQHNWNKPGFNWLQRKFA